MEFPGIISTGSTNKAAIKQIKLRLNALSIGYLDPENPNFGDSTKTAVMAFQKKNLLIEDGIVGDLTWSKLFKYEPRALYTGKEIGMLALSYAMKSLNVREATGHNDGTEVERFLESVGLEKGNPWCASFAYYNFQQAADELKITNPVYKSGHVLTLWNKTPALNRVYSNPKPGDLFIMSFGGGTGHIGHVIKVNGERMWTVEGNTNLNSSREGDGVYERSRLISAVNKGFIRY